MTTMVMIVMIAVIVTALLIFSLYDVVAYYPYPIVMIATGRRAGNRRR